jgi:hypothetical protein
VAAAAAQVAQVLIGGEAAVDDPDAAAEPPAAQVVLDLADHGLVVAGARPDPDPDRDPLARDGEPDHDLRQVGPLILGVVERPKRWPRTDRVRLGLEGGRGGVEEEQIDLQVQQVGAGEENRLLHPCLGVRVDQQLERPVGLVVTAAPRIEPVLAAEVEQHLGTRHAVLAAVVRKLQVAHQRPILPPPRRAQVRAHTDSNNTGTAELR